MFGLGGQTAEGVFDGGGLEGRELGAVLAYDPFSERRTGGDGGGAAAHLVTGFDRDWALPSNRKPEDVSARGVGDFHRDGRGGQVAHIAGILKMLQQPVGIHMLQYSDMVQVVAAIVERDGTVLIGRRRADQSHPLQWEFPGGKVEAGETPAQALARELEEELGIGDVAGEEIARYEYTYPGKNPILLMFFRVLAFTGEPRNRVFQEIRWEARAALLALDFVEGDRDFLRTFAVSGASR